MFDSPKAVIFDYGQVLSYREKADHLKRIAALCRIEYSSFLQVYDTHVPAYDRGDFTGVELWHRVLPALGVEPTSDLVEVCIDEDTASTLMLNPQMLAWTDLLRNSGLQTAILSNMSPDDLIRMRESDIEQRLSGFSVRIFSTEVRLIKPDPRIYHLCLTKLGLPANETLFIDDNEANIDAARELGLRASLFFDYHHSVPEICRTHRLPIPP